MIIWRVIRARLLLFLFLEESVAYCSFLLNSAGTVQEERKKLNKLKSRGIKIENKENVDKQK